MLFGERGLRAVADGSYCDPRNFEKCRACGNYDGTNGIQPYTILQGHPFCAECYPKMVAVLMADDDLMRLYEQMSKPIAVLASDSAARYLEQLAGLWPHLTEDERSTLRLTIYSKLIDYMPKTR
jgi:hypothetical protein